MAYKSYDPSVDYADRLRRMMQAGASAAEVESTLRQRVQKATQEPGHEKYAYDAYYAAARDYIDSRNSYNGYTGGSGQYTSSAASSYTDPYADRLESALERLEAREPFSYNPEDDPAYQAYRTAYGRPRRQKQLGRCRRVDRRTGEHRGGRGGLTGAGCV